MDQIRLYSAARTAEVLTNYSIADNTDVNRNNEDDYTLIYHNDEMIWADLFQRAKTHVLEKKDLYIDIYDAFISEWIPRIPGLYWMPNSKKLRALDKSAIEKISDKFIQYKPSAKSQKVEGGVGTFRLHEAINGMKMMTLTKSFNASTGVPALFTPDVLDKLNRLGKPFDGIRIEGCAFWRQIHSPWSDRFASIKNTPRGCLVFDNPDDIKVYRDDVTIQIHPFSVMKYYDGSNELYDYVYATMYTGDYNERVEIEKWFNSYKNERDRCGEYLVAGDMIDPLWESQFNTPQELRRTLPNAESQLKLIEARVTEVMFRNKDITSIIDIINNSVDSIDDLKRLSIDIQMPHTLWLRGGTLAQETVNFVEQTHEMKKILDLVDLLAISYPKYFN